MTTMTWRIARMVADHNVPTVVTTLTVTAITVSTAAAVTALRSWRQSNALHNDAQCRKAAARWLNSPEGRRWIALKSGENLDDDSPR